jgi:hypothetical protein
MLRSVVRKVTTEFNYDNLNMWLAWGYVSNEEVLCWGTLLEETRRKCSWQETRKLILAIVMVSAGG